MLFEIVCSLYILLACLYNHEPIHVMIANRYLFEEISEFSLVIKDLWSWDGQIRVDAVHLDEEKILNARIEERILKLIVLPNSSLAIESYPHLLGIYDIQDTSAIDRPNYHLFRDSKEVPFEKQGIINTKPKGFSVFYKVEAAQCVNREVNTSQGKDKYFDSEVTICLSLGFLIAGCFIIVVLFTELRIKWKSIEPELNKTQPTQATSNLLLANITKKDSKDVEWYQQELTSTLLAQNIENTVLNSIEIKLTEDLRDEDIQSCLQSFSTLEISLHPNLNESGDMNHLNGATVLIETPPSDLDKVGFLEIPKKLKPQKIRKCSSSRTNIETQKRTQIRDIANRALAKAREQLVTEILVHLPLSERHQIEGHGGATQFTQIESLFRKRRETLNTQIREKPKIAHPVCSTGEKKPVIIRPGSLKIALLVVENVKPRHCIDGQFKKKSLLRENIRKNNTSSRHRHQREYEASFLKNEIFMDDIKITSTINVENHRKGTRKQKDRKINTIRPIRPSSVKELQLEPAKLDIRNSVFVPFINRRDNDSDMTEKMISQKFMMNSYFTTEEQEGFERRVRVSRRGTHPKRDGLNRVPGMSYSQYLGQ